MSSHRDTYTWRVSAPAGVGPVVLISVFVAAFATHAAAQVRPIDLGTLGGNNSSAIAVNATGQVVGYSELRDGSTHAFSWTEQGGMIDLGTLGGQYSVANAVNASGQVVGWSTTADGIQHAFTWTRRAG
jgi:probable HAF family extracellular repeat protein